MREKKKHYSLLPGNGTSNWVDARLTEVGKSQAQTAHNTWKQQLKEYHIPTPEKFYVSPLNRCLETAWITFVGTGMEGTEPFRPVVKEVLTSTYLSTQLPSFVIAMD